MKTCVRCLSVLDDSRFGIMRGYPDKTCKSCRTKAISEYRKTPKGAEKRRAYAKRRWAKNRKKMVEYHRKWKLDNPEKTVWTKEQYRKYRLAAYGLTPENYDSLLKAQGEVCAICGGTNKPGKDGGLLHIDHDHSTGKVRGLLCGQCNRGLGHFKDNPDSLRKAALYLEASNG